MKKILIALAILISLNSHAQRVGQPIGAANSIVYGRGGIMADQGLINSRLDTLNHPMKDSLGAMTYWSSKLWLRVPFKWIEVGTGAQSIATLQQAITSGNIFTKSDTINTAGYDLIIQNGLGSVGSRLILRSSVSSFFLGTASSTGGTENINIFGSSELGYMNIVSPLIQLGSTNSITQVNPTAITSTTGVNLGNATTNKFRRYYGQRVYADTLDASVYIGLPSSSGSGIAPTDYIVRETPSGTVNGTNTIFTLAFTPVAGKEMVFLNGLLQMLTSDYTISAATITFVTAPFTGDKIRVTYIK